MLFVLLVLLSNVDPAVGTVVTPIACSIHNGIVSERSERPITCTGIFITNVPKGKTSASSLNAFGVRRMPPNVCDLRTSYVKCRAISAPRCVISTSAPFVRVRVRRSTGLLGAMIIIPSPFQQDVRDPIDVHVVNLRRVRGDPKTGQSISHVMHSCPNISFSPVNCHGSLVIQNNSPSRGHFCVSNVRVPGVGRFTARNTSKKPMDVIGTSLVHRVAFCANTFPTGHSKTLDSILSFHLGSKGPSGRTFGTAVNTSRISLDKTNRLKRHAACLFSTHRSCLRLLFGTLKLPFLPGFVSKRFGAGAHFGRRDRLALLNLTNVSGVGLGASRGKRSTRCLLDCLPAVRRRAFALKTSCERCGKERMRSLVLDRGCLGGHGLGCHGGSSSSRSGLALHLHSARRGAALHFRGRAHLKT